MRQKKILLLVVVLVIVIAGAAFAYHQLSGSVEKNQLVSEGSTQEETNTEEKDQTGTSEESEDSTKEEKAAAPDFTVYDLDGNEVKLSTYIGKPIVLNFWASWCPPCKSEMPDFEEAYKNLGSEVQFLMINMTDGTQETVESGSTYIAEQGYTFPVFYDKNMDAAMKYGAYSLPTTYFIDAEGYVAARGSGAMDAATLQKGIDMIYP